jgi:hypothetical protein
MKPHKLFIFVSACNLLLWIFVAARPTKESFEKITVKEFELVDDSARRHKRSRILYLDHVDGDESSRWTWRASSASVGFAVQSNGEALTLLDQNQEFPRASPKIRRQ